ncbi:MAG: ABC transporter permease subunit [Xenococcaceae cyanobacterium]
MLQLIEGIFNGVSIGSVLLIAALGLAIVFGLMGVINLAHGELMMIGAYTTFVVQNIAKSFLGGALLPIYFILAIPIAFIVTALIGLLLEKGLIRHLYGRPLETLLATWGVSLILQQFVRSANWAMIISVGIFCLLFLVPRSLLSRLSNWSSIGKLTTAILFLLSLAIALSVNAALNKDTISAIAKPWFGARNVNVTPPSWMTGSVSIGGLQLPAARLFIIALTAICLIGTYLFLQRSNWGLRIRAVTQNRSMSACLGIPTETIDGITFAIGSGLAGIAGVAISLLGSVGPNVGQNYIVDTFMVVVVGGVGNFLGTIIAAGAIGTISYLIGSGTLGLISSSLPSLQPLTDFFTFFATASMAKVMVFALIIAFLQVKPSGIFPQKGRTAEL